MGTDDSRELGRGTRRLRPLRSGPPRDRVYRAGDPRNGRRGDREAWRAAGLPRADRRAEGPAPIRECPSDIGGWMDTRTPFRWARRHLHRSLAALRLHHGRRSGDADPELAAVDGSDPPFGMAGTASGRADMGTPMPSSAGGRSRPAILAGRVFSAAAGRRITQFADRPAGVSALPQRTGRGPAENARPWAAGNVEP